MATKISSLSDLSQFLRGLDTKSFRDLFDYDTHFFHSHLEQYRKSLSSWSRGMPRPVFSYSHAMSRIMLGLPSGSVSNSLDMAHLYQGFYKFLPLFSMYDESGYFFYSLYSEDFYFDKALMLGNYFNLFFIDSFIVFIFRTRDSNTSPLRMIVLSPYDVSADCMCSVDF